MERDIDLTPIFAGANIIDIWCNVKVIPDQGYELTWGDSTPDWHGHETFHAMSEVVARVALMMYCGERTWYANFRQTEHGFRDAINQFFLDNTGYD